MKYYKFHVRHTEVATVCVAAENEDEARGKMTESWEEDDGFWVGLEHELYRNDDSYEYEFEGETDDVCGMTIG